jgi:hypothetical protein
MEINWTRVIETMIVQLPHTLIALGIFIHQVFLRKDVDHRISDLHKDVDGRMTELRGALIDAGRAKGIVQGVEMAAGVKPPQEGIDK